jgi:hypothetical protein
VDLCMSTQVHTHAYEQERQNKQPNPSFTSATRTHSVWTTLL